MSKHTIQNYYIAKYGEPSRRAKFVSPEGIIVEIFKWNKNATSEGVAIYATIGASNVLGDSVNGCEFFIGLEPEVDDIVQALAEVALHGNGSNSIPNLGDSITLSYALWKDTEANSFLFTNGSELIPAAQIGQKKIEFIQLVPLYASELQFKKLKGEDALWEVFEEKGVPYWSSIRGPEF